MVNSDDYISTNENDLQQDCIFFTTIVAFNCNN